MRAYRVALFADADGVGPKITAKRLFYGEDGFEGFNVDMIEQSLEAPADTLAGHVEIPRDLFAIVAAENHVIRRAGLEFHPQFMVLHEPAKPAEERHVFLGEFHEGEVR